MNEQNSGASRAGKTLLDFRLIPARLEEEILDGKNPAKCRAILNREDVWTKLDTEMQLKWARLAQMAGEVELALKVLAHINRTSPETADSWNERLELLSILGRGEELARVLAASRKYLGKKHYGMWHGLREKAAAEEDKDISAALTPFARLRERQEAVKRYLDLFSGREDCFARQWVNKAEVKQGYVPVRRPMEEQDIEDHLAGKKTLGIYLLRSDSTVKTAVIDVDISTDLRKSSLNREEAGLIRRERTYLFTRIRELAGEAALFPVAEFSGGKGFHFWFFFEMPVAAAKARRPLEQIRRVLSKDLSAFHLEVFPKQDNLSGKGFGNLVKLPLGIHRLTGKRSYFVGCRSRDPEAQLGYLEKIRKTSPDRMETPAEDDGKAEIFIHPRMKEWAEQYPELMALESLCPPLGQIIASSRSGNQLSLREEKVLFQTVGFLPRAKTLMHYLVSSTGDYNPHLVDYKLSRLRGTPLGCRRIHSLLDFAGDVCVFKRTGKYAHPLLHVEQWKEQASAPSEKGGDLSSALENLKRAILQTEAFLK